MKTRCGAWAVPAAASTRLRAASTSPLRLPAQWMIGVAHRVFEPLAPDQVTHDELDPIPGFMIAAAEDTHGLAVVEQTLDDEPPERPGAAGNENHVIRPIAGAALLIATHPRSAWS
jgi:hypothetical protein